MDKHNTGVFVYGKCFFFKGEGGVSKRLWAQDGDMTRRGISERYWQVVY